MIGFLFVLLISPAAAQGTITCDQVRAYVGQVGQAQATANARAQGMTSGQERQARQCLVGGKVVKRK